MHWETVKIKEGTDLHVNTFRSRKKKLISRESEWRFKELLAGAVVKILQHCLSTLKVHINENQESDRGEVTELFVLKCGSNVERMNSTSENSTISLQDPKKRYYYIAATIYAFREIICDWIVNVFDCYILNTKYLSQKFL